MNNIKIKYSYTVDVDEVLDEVGSKLARFYRKTNIENDLEELSGDIISCGELDQVDGLVIRIDELKSQLNKLFILLEESKEIIQTYKQAKSGDFEKDPEGETTSQPKNSTDVLNSLRNIYGEIKKNNDSG